MRPNLLAAAIVLASCGSPAAPAAAPLPPSASPAADRVDGATAHSLVQGGAMLVDVRNPDEFAAQHIDGAVNVPAAEIASHDFGGKDKAVVLYCAHGHRSQQAGEALRSQGYTRVYVLGPMSAWGP